jgi:putative hydrolase of the HAD superfamily
MSIDVILFDFGGVIYTPLRETIVQECRMKLALQLGFSSTDQMWQRFYGGSEWNLAKTGRTTEDEMWQNLLTPLGLESNQSQTAFVAELYRDTGLKDEMRELIADLHKHYRLAILSNASDKLGTLLSDHLQVSEFFEVIVNSSEIGVAKPNKDAYFIALELLAASPDQVLFIDDQCRNTIAAEKLSINSLVFKCVEELRSDLIALNLLHQ